MCSYSYPVLHSVSHLVQMLPLKSILTSQLFNQLAFSSCFTILQCLISSTTPPFLKFPPSLVSGDTVPSCFPPAFRLCFLYLDSFSFFSHSLTHNSPPGFWSPGVSLSQRFQPFPSRVPFESLFLGIFISNTNLPRSKSNSFLPTVSASLLYFY